MRGRPGRVAGISRTGRLLPHSRGVYIARVSVPQATSQAKPEANRKPKQQNTNTQRPDRSKAKARNPPRMIYDLHAFASNIN